jgi:class 3 adenylate cyclase
VLIGPETWERVHDHARAVPLGTLRLKGKREPVEVFDLVAVDA